jgi:hypothetical protein
MFGVFYVIVIGVFDSSVVLGFFIRCTVFPDTYIYLRESD